MCCDIHAVPICSFLAHSEVVCKTSTSLLGLAKKPFFGHLSYRKSYHLYWVWSFSWDNKMIQSPGPASHSWVFCPHQTPVWSHTHTTGGSKEMAIRTQAMVISRRFLGAKPLEDREDMNQIYVDHEYPLISIDDIGHLKKSGTFSHWNEWAAWQKVTESSIIVESSYLCLCRNASLLLYGFLHVLYILQKRGNEQPTSSPGDSPLSVIPYSIRIWNPNGEWDISL